MNKNRIADSETDKGVALDGNAGALSRRSVIAGAAMIGVGAVCMAASRAQAQSKMSQADAKYQDKPNGEDYCEKCALFQAPDACQGVDGKISPQGWCSLYSPKA